MAGQFGGAHAATGLGGLPSLGQGAAPMGQDAILSDPRVQAYVLQQKADAVEQSVIAMAGQSGLKGAELNALIDGIKQGVKEAYVEAQADISNGAASVAAPAPRRPGGAHLMASAAGAAAAGAVRGHIAANVAPMPGGPAHKGDFPEGQDLDPTNDVRGAPGQRQAPLSYDQGKNLGGSLKQIEATLARRVNDMQSPYMRDETGNVVERATGRVIGAHEAGVGGEYDAAMSSMARYGRMKSMASPLMEGVGIRSALGAGLKVAGPVGVAVGVGQAVTQGLEKVNQTLTPYRQMYGGSTLDQGQAWLGEQLYGLQGIGTMGSGMAREQYRAVSELGLTGDERGQSLDFMRQQYGRFGLGTQDTMPLVEMTAKSTTLSLDQLSKQIEAVGESAVKAGGNAKEAIALFQSNLTQVTGSVSATTSATAFAANITKVTDNLHGTPLEGLTEGGLMAGDRGMLTATAATGMSVEEVQQALTAPGIQGEIELGRINNSIIDFWVTNYLGITPAQQGKILEQLKLAGGGELPEELEPAQAERIVVSVTGSRWSRAQIIQSAQSVGLGQMEKSTALNETNAFLIIAYAIMGKLDATIPEKPVGVPVSAFTEGASKDFTEKGVTQDGKKAEGSIYGSAPDQATLDNYSSPVGGGMSTMDELYKRLGYDASGGLADISKAAGNKLGYGTTGMTGAFDDKSNPAAWYLDYIRKTGKYNTIIEGLLGEDSIETALDSKYEVSTSSGKKMVSLQELISTYGDQVGNPSMKVQTPDGESTIATLAPDAFKSSAPSGGSATGGSSISPSSGSTTSSFSSDISRLLDLTPQAKKLLRLINADGTATGAQRTGSPASGRQDPRDY